MVATENIIKPAETGHSTSLLTVKEVAKLLNVSVRTVENEIADGSLVPLRIRGTRRFRQQAIQDYLSSKATR